MRQKKGNIDGYISFSINGTSQQIDIVNAGHAEKHNIKYILIQEFYLLGLTWRNNWGLK